MGGVVEFNQVFLDGVRLPDFWRVGAVNDGWRVASASLAGERQMVAGAGSGGVDRIGGSGVGSVIDLARQEHRTAHGPTRQRLAQAYVEERLRAWTNQRVRATARAGEGPGPAASIGKLHQAELNQALQLLAADLLGPRSAAWPAPPDGDPDQWAAHLPYEVRGMLRSRANTIEAGTTEVNRNIVAERVLGLPREPDPWAATTWQDTPRS
jgi:alkylation response protein AidB-like acyl-CoA dehydrogenase